MSKDYGMYQGYNVEGTAEVKITPDKTNTSNEMMNGCMNNSYSNGYNYGYMPEMLPGIVCPPVYECPEERCIHREICHEVPQE